MQDYCSDKHLASYETCKIISFINTSTNSGNNSITILARLYGEPFVSKFETDNSFELLYISFEICNSFEFDAKFIRVLHTIHSSFAHNNSFDFCVIIIVKAKFRVIDCACA